MEGLLDDEDFRAKVTRAEYEDMCEDLFTRIAKPVEDAIKISQVTWVGGRSKLVNVLERIDKWVKKHNFLLIHLIRRLSLRRILIYIHVFSGQLFSNSLPHPHPHPQK